MSTGGLAAVVTLKRGWRDILRESAVYLLLLLMAAKRVSTFAR